MSRYIVGCNADEAYFDTLEECNAWFRDQWSRNADVLADGGVIEDDRPDGQLAYYEWDGNGFVETKFSARSRAIYRRTLEAKAEEN